MNDSAEIIPVEQTLPHERLDAFLRRRLPGMSRGTIQRLIEEGHITVNGAPVKAAHHPHAGELVEIRRPAARPAAARPENIPLAVLFEDDDLLVLNKPAGLVVHPAAGHEEHTLVNALLHHCRDGLSGVGGVARPGIVHRLDKETSGCLVVAKNDAAHLALSAQFSDRTTQKIYHALVCGHPPAAGEIDAAIARHPAQRQRMAVTSGSGRDARTDWRVVRQLPAAALVEAQIHTGRTHQIRVHFQYAGFPVVGDSVYGAKPNRRLSEQTGYTAPRQLLHAARLVLKHPQTGKTMTFDAPWPEDFKEGLARLSQNAV